jgi:flavin-dependent dehydrogenase
VAFVRQSTDVFVIGGGPAGLAAAIAAKRQGFTVTLADGSAPLIDKACGEGLMPATRGALNQLGVSLPVGEGFLFRGIGFVQAGVHVPAEFPKGLGIGIRRTVLHQTLIQAAERCGVNLLWKTPVVGIDKHSVRLIDGDVKTRWILGADGGQSRVRRWADLDAAITNKCRMATRRHYRVPPWSEFMEIHWGPRLQACVTPIARDEVCIVILAETVDEADFDRALRVLPQLRERLAGAELCSRQRGAVTSMHSLARVWRGNVALVGDASGGVDAITGEGLRLAFQQARALAEAMHKQDLSAYGRTHRQIARRPLWMGRLMLGLGRFDSLRSRAFATLQGNPELFTRLLAVHVGHARTTEVLSAGARMTLQFLASGERN